MAKFSKKLVSKCIYIQILKSTDTDLLCQFMGSGGWNLTHLWLQDAVTTQNWPLVQEILELLLSCPVDVERLKSNTAPRLVKQLTKDNNVEAVRILAAKLVEQWLRIVRGESTPTVSAVQSESEASQDAITSSGKKEKGDDAATEISDEAQEEDTADEVDEAEKAEETVAEEEVVKKTPEKVILKIKGKKVIIKSSPVPEKSKQQTEITAQTDPLHVDMKQSSADGDSAVDEVDDTECSEEIKSEKKSKSTSSKSTDSSKSSSSHKSSKSSSSSSKHKSSSSRSTSKDNKERDKDRDRDKHRSSSKSSSKSSSSTSAKSVSNTSSSRDKDKDKERHSKKREEELQSHKDAKTLAEIAPESLKRLGVIGKIPKKPREESTDKDKSKPTPTGPRVKPTFSIEERDPEKRSKTVKTFNSKFRSHGLEDTEPPPPPQKKILAKKPSSPPHNTASINNTNHSSNNGLKRHSPPHSMVKDPQLSPPAEKRPKTEERTNDSKLSPSRPKQRKSSFSPLLILCTLCIFRSLKSALELLDHGQLGAELRIHLTLIHVYGDVISFFISFNLIQPFWCKKGSAKLSSL